MPLETLEAIDKMWNLPFFREEGESVKVVTMDDLDKVDSYMRPPLE